MLRTLLNKMEDDDQHETVEMINDEEDDNEEGVLIDTQTEPETVLIDTAAAALQLAQDNDDDAVCLHCTECNLTLATFKNLRRHQQSKRHQSRVDAAAGKAASSSEHHCDVCNASFKSNIALKRHEQTMKHQDNVDPEGAEPRKKAKVVEAQAKLATPEGKAAAEKKAAGKLAQAQKKAADKAAQAATPEGKAAAEKKASDKALKSTERNQSRDRRGAGQKAKHLEAVFRQYERRKLTLQAHRDSVPAPYELGNGTVEDAKKALVRYYASTNIPMLLESEPEAIVRNIERFCNVTSETKQQMRDQWDADMNVGAPLNSCSTCGVRDVDDSYEKWAMLIYQTSSSTTKTILNG